jgi:hypothetical protein
MGEGTWSGLGKSWFSSSFFSPGIQGRGIGASLKQSMGERGVIEPPETSARGKSRGTSLKPRTGERSIVEPPETSAARRATATAARTAGWQRVGGIVGNKRIGSRLLERFTKVMGPNGPNKRFTKVMGTKDGQSAGF